MEKKVSFLNALLLLNLVVGGAANAVVPPVAATTKSARQTAVANKTTNLVCQNLSNSF